MSLQPFVSRWYFAMARTIPAESSAVYWLAVTVWCTKAICTSPYSGLERGGTAAAPHCVRGMMAGGPSWAPRAARRVAARRIAGRPTATKCTRSPRGARRARSCSSSAPPAQTGSLAPATRGRSGACSTPTPNGVQGLHAPPERRTRTSTWASGSPRPRRPSRSKRRGARSTPVARPPVRVHAAKGTSSPKERVRSVAAAQPSAGVRTRDVRPAVAPRARARRRVTA